jgi:outer membrane protein assembly factor BamE (lipoprotein component of BamABCDE complex)
MLSRVMPSQRQLPAFLNLAVYVTALLAALLTLDGCFFFRSKPDPRVQELTSHLEAGLTTDEVLSLIGPPQRQGQNLFDRRKEYWIYEFAREQKKKRRRGNDAENNSQEPVLQSELQLLFDRGKLVNWSHVPRNE